MESKGIINKNSTTMKNRVIGIGGIFFKSKDPAITRTWYEKHLGIKPDGDYGSTFEWRKADAPDKKAIQHGVLSLKIPSIFYLHRAK
jgi:hypothetical protein